MKATDLSPGAAVKVLYKAKEEQTETQDVPAAPLDFNSKFTTRPSVSTHLQ